MPSLPSFGFRGSKKVGRTSPSDPPSPKPGPSPRIHRGHVYLTVFVFFLHLISLIFLILVIVGNLDDQAVLRDIYFIKLDLSHIIPRSVPDARLINSIARSIGLHDFYQVGLWNFCEGFDVTGITFCSDPQALYWFNPIEILLNELLAGATIALPADITDALNLVRKASQGMFALYMLSAPLTFFCIILAPLSPRRWPREQKRRKWYFLRNLPLTILTFLAALSTVIATVIATVMYVIFCNVFRNGSAAADLNIGAQLGTRMFVFMWIAAGAALFGFLIQVMMACGACFRCCGAGRVGKTEEQREEQSGDLVEKNRVLGIKRRLGWRNKRVAV